MSGIRTRTIVRSFAAALALVVPLGLTACGGDDDKATDTTAASKTTEGTSADAEELTVEDVWARTATAGGNGAVYMTITGGATDDALVKAAVPADIADRVELHETKAEGSTTSMAGGSEMTPTSMGAASDDEATSTTAMGGGMMKMQQVEQIDVPAGGKVDLKPGGFHVMLFELKKDLVVGDTVKVTLTFADGGERTVDAAVREL